MWGLFFFSQGRSRSSASGTIMGNTTSPWWRGICRDARASSRVHGAQSAMPGAQLRFDDLADANEYELEWLRVIGAAQPSQQQQQQQPSQPGQPCAARTGDLAGLPSADRRGTYPDAGQGGNPHSGIANLGNTCFVSSLPCGPRFPSSCFSISQPPRGALANAPEKSQVQRGMVALPSQRRSR